MPPSHRIIRRCWGFLARVGPDSRPQAPSTWRPGPQGDSSRITADLAKIQPHEQADVRLREGDVVVVEQSGWRKALLVLKELLPGSVNGAYRVNL